MFGEIKNGEMYLNDAGRMVEKWYWELENKYPDKKCREMVVMPNHFHCIIENVKTDEYGDDGMDAPPYTSAPPRIDAHVGTSLRGRPEPTNEGGRPEPTNDGERPDSTNDGGRSQPTKIWNDLNHSSENQNNPYGSDNQKIKSPLGEAVGWFKTMTTNAYIRGVKNNQWKRFNKRLWQRNYYEHIIRSPKAYERISKYIIENPLKWRDDKFYL